MATMAAVDLGAQSGRVAVGRFDGERLELDRGAPLPERAGASCAARSTGTSSASTARCSTGSAPPAPRRRRSTRSASTPGASTSGCSTGAAGSSVTPSTTATTGGPQRSSRVLARVPARELYERTGIQLLPINTLFELGGDGRRGRPGARRRRDAAADPRPAPLLALRRRAWASGRTRPRRSASTRAAAPGPTDLLERLGIPSRAAAAKSSIRGRRSGALAADVAADTGVGTPTVVAVGDARHRLGGRGRAVPRRPARPTSAPARGRSSASRWPSR